MVHHHALKEMRDLFVTWCTEAGCTVAVDRVRIGGSGGPFCSATPPTARPAPPAALASAELAAEVPGHTFTVGRQQLHFASGGRLYGRAGGDADLGTWAIDRERLCRTWTMWDHGIRRCYVIVRDGDAYVFDLPERFGRFPARRTAGGFAP